MPRFRRIIQPGDLVHVICRFVNREFRLTCAAERHEYLSRLGRGIAQSDWRAVCYACMSSHTHTAYIAGFESFERLIKTVHSPFALWLNRRQGRLGPVFADRPKTIVIDPVWAPRLIAYHHNNPARAGVARTAEDSDWTSHRAYLGRVHAPAWLDVKLGLELMELSTCQADREAFGRYVLERTREPRDEMLTGNLSSANRRLREGLGNSISIEHPRSGPSGIDYRPRTDANRWRGQFEEIVQRVAIVTRTSADSINGPSRRRFVVAARRITVLVAQSLGLTNAEIGRRLGVSETAVRHHARVASDSDRSLSERILRDLQ